MNSFIRTGTRVGSLAGSAGHGDPVVLYMDLAAHPLMNTRAW